MPKVRSKDGTTIAYVKKGQGPVVILVLGALNKRGSGKKLMDLLADNFTVISYDRRGRGDSTDTMPYSIDKEIQDIEALIDNFGGKANLYGHSSGSILALLAAKEMPGKVSAVALYELPYDDSPPAQEAARTYRNELKKMVAGDKRGEAVALFVKSVGVTDKQIAAMKKLPMWKGLTDMAPTLVYDTVELMEKYIKIEFKDIGTKSLLMYGTSSPPFMKGTAQTLSYRLPNSKLHPLQGQNHDVKAEAMAPVLAKFFK